MAGDPVFIGGMYRSGTSLLRAMLGRHSQLFAGLETQWLHETWAVPADRRQWLARLSVFYDVQVDELEQACGDTLNAGQALDSVMEMLTARADKRRWIEKTPGNAGVIDGILRHWPHAKVLHILRDPRDVYASHVTSQKRMEPEEFSERWCGTVGAARDWLAGVGGSHPAYLELQYERLVLAPVQVMQQVLAFIDEPWEPKVAAFEGQPEDFERVRRATGKESTTLMRLAEPLSTSRIGAWRDVLEPAKWNAVRSAIARRGYGPLLDALVAEADGQFGLKASAGARAS